jgi:hypothetical protein
VSTGRTIEVTRDAEQAVIDFCGGPIDVDTLRAVRGLGENLERELGSGVTDAEDVLLRVVSFVGDAHVGLDLERIVASRPAEVDVVPVDSAVDDVVRLGMTAVVAGIPVAAAEQLCASAVTTLTPALLAAACQQNGGEGIKYISCYEGRRYTHHDASGHCYTSYYVYAGLVRRTAGDGADGPVRTSAASRARTRRIASTTTAARRHIAAAAAATN